MLKVSIDEIRRDYSDFDEAKRFIDFFAIIVGVIIHDLSKGSIRKTSETMSHSQMMLKKPDYIMKEADSLLTEVENQTGLKIKEMSKGSIRKTSETMSHSQMMLKKPDYIMKEADSLLTEVENQTGLKIKENIRKNITHIVVSHHGRWGKIAPNTREAHIVHRADMYSAKYHRINPIGANEILEALCMGENLVEVSKRFMCTTGVIKDRK